MRCKSCLRIVPDSPKGACDPCVARAEVVPGEPKNDTLYCQRKPDGFFDNFYRSGFGVRMAVGSKMKGDVVHVRLVPDDEGEFWCWHDFGDDTFSMVWPSLSLLGMCFGALSGMERREKADRGIRARVRVEVLEVVECGVKPGHPGMCVHGTRACARDHDHTPKGD